MNNLLFGSIFNNTLNNINLIQFLSCMLSGIVLGIFVALIYKVKTKSTKSFLATLALLPVIVSMVIIMVNGNIGAGVAVAGAFSLVRFRSVPGTAKEIGAIFTAMSIGLTLGMGYLGFAFLFALIACGFMVFLSVINFGEEHSDVRILQITIPENLNYINSFDEIFEKYTKQLKLLSSKTTNMGSLFKLSYEFELKDTLLEKEFIDEIRVRNGNLEISITKAEIFNNGL